MNKNQPEIIVGICGGVAAYKSAMLISRLVQAGYSVWAVPTRSALEFIGPATLRALSGRDPVIEMFDPQFPLGPHIELARRAQAMVVVPATANFLAKAAQGLADDLLSTLYLSVTAPIICCPAMNVEMWNKPAVQRNVRQLQDDGVEIVGPTEGWLSCRVKGMGRLAEPDMIFDTIVKRVPKPAP